MEYKNGFSRVGEGPGWDSPSESLDREIELAREARRHHIEEIRDHINALSRVTTDTAIGAVNNFKDRWSLAGVVTRNPWFSVGVSLLAGVLAGRELAKGRAVSSDPSLIGEAISRSGANRSGEFKKSVLRSAIEAGLVEMGGVAVAASLRMIRDHVDNRPAAKSPGDSLQKYRDELDGESFGH